MELEGALLWLNVAIVLIQLAIWRWARTVERNLRGHDGHQLASVVSKLIGGVTLARLVGSIGFATHNLTPDDLTSTLVVTIVSQLIVLGVIIWAVVRVRQFGDAQ